MTLEQEIEKAHVARMQRECIEVSLVNKPLVWRVDHHQVVEWQRALLKWNEPFTMVDMRTGEPIPLGPKEGE